MAVCFFFLMKTSTNHEIEICIYGYRNEFSLDLGKIRAL